MQIMYLYPTSRPAPRTYARAHLRAWHARAARLSFTFSVATIRRKWKQVVNVARRKMPATRWRGSRYLLSNDVHMYTKYMYTKNES
jgi:hypothetical protein